MSCWYPTCCWGNSAMKKEDILRRLNALELDKQQYWVITGSAMVLHGLREQTHDIDLGCTRELANELERQGLPVSILKDGSRKFLIGQDIEIFENWLYDEVEILDGVPVISRMGLLEMKRRLGREKDQRDIRLIEASLAAE